MNSLRVSFLLLALLALVTGGCTSQPPVKAQSDFDAAFTLRTVMRDGRMIFEGVGGEINGTANPDLIASVGDTVRVVLVNGDGITHDFAVPDLNVQTSLVMTYKQATEVVFQVNRPGEFIYYCTVAGHRQMGMEGKLIVSEP